MKKGFFEFILAADKEKIHSQFLGWMLSSYCEVLSPAEKEKFLQCLTGSTDKFEITDVDVEITDMDVLVECVDFVVVIENKIKSTLQSHQLAKYHEYAVTNYSKPQAPKLIYLNLLGEPSPDVSWLGRSYHHLFTCLSSLTLLEGNNDRVFIEEYREMVRRLLEVISASMNDKPIREWVFKLHKNKNAALYKAGGTKIETVDYIIKCQLARFIQKYYYKEVSDHLNTVKAGLDYQAYYGFSEREGEGLVQVRFQTLFFTERGVRLFGGFQIQGNVLKVNISADDFKGNKDSLPDNIQQFMAILKGRLSYKGRRNPAQSAAYASVSTPLRTLVSNYSPNELAMVIRGELQRVYIPFQDLINEYYSK